MADLDIIEQIQKELTIEASEKENKPRYSLNRSGQITLLDLSECNLIDVNRIISLIRDLKDLKHLDLNYNNLSDISPLKDLTNLDALDLSYNALEDKHLMPAQELKEPKNVNAREKSHSECDFSYGVWRIVRAKFREKSA